MKIEEFEHATNEAFSYLASKYDYNFEAARRGGHFGSAFVRRFKKDQLVITLLMGDADSHNFCNVFFSDGLDVGVHKISYMERSLSILLKTRLPDFKHPSSQELKTPESRIEALYLYGSLIEKYALDVVAGDFSCFPTLIFALHHTDSKSKIYRFIGVYSTLDLVNQAISERIRKHGYDQRSNGFEITRIEVDGLGNWYAGIPIDDEITT
ncbi:hypothetical protein [Aurantivibrio plasticivorans]